ncbi:transcription antitermination factor NusB [Massiliimalia massiliensis]|jgi:N utilization substance protein B|uniref:transcription antitermination factor NusB n=1 Tax=Massiliimalia massiliensis TaxID=1852384 RepID=UPI0009869534|nr:transcription antitermination factor NusB [Massiliimalia massiliensis]
MTRHQMREAAFMLTFERIFNQDSVEEMIQAAQECDSFELNEQAIALFRGADDHREELDSVIAKHLKNWTLARISKVSLAVLRLAIYEMKYCDDISDEIAISEAVKIAQTYTLKDDVTFINGVLASVSKDV